MPLLTVSTGCPLFGALGAELRKTATHPLTGAITHCGGEEAARLERLQSHGAGVCPKEQDEGHQGDVRHEDTGLSDQLPSVLLTLLPGQGRPGGIHWLERQGQKRFLQPTSNNIFKKQLSFSF